MAAKCDWIVLIPDHEGVLEKRLAARQYAVLNATRGTIFVDTSEPGHISMV